MMHYPVMLPEVLGALAMQDCEVCVDGTFGNGGYSEAILNSASCAVIGLDRDPNVTLRAKGLGVKWGDRFRLIQTPFSKMDELGLDPVDAVVLDIGVSSMQLDQAERGFSFMREGPLDMRMEQGGGPTARDAVLHLSAAELTRIFQVYGEEKRARHVANCILSARECGDIVKTTDLAEILEKALGRRGKTHPATRVFQALRIFVNDELGELYRGLFTLPRRSVTKPSKFEIEENARSRSAKLRVAVRTEFAAFDADDRLLPDVISLAELEARL